MTQQDVRALAKELRTDAEEVRGWSAFIADNMVRAADALEQPQITAEEVRDAALEEAASIADKASTHLAEHANRARASGDDARMYRANTAWHNTTAIAQMIREIKSAALNRAKHGEQT